MRIKKINKMLDDGINVQILGYDGYNYQKENKSLKECFDDDSRPFGHELCLIALLNNEKIIINFNSKSISSS